MINTISIQNIPASIKRGYTIKKSNLYAGYMKLTESDILQAVKKRDREQRKRERESLKWMTDFCNGVDLGLIEI